MFNQAEHISHASGFALLHASISSTVGSSFYLVPKYVEAEILSVRLNLV